MRYDFGDYILRALVGIMLLGVATMIVVAVGDSVQSYRSFEDRVACEAQRMVPKRNVLSTKVICVPVPMRQDTLTLHR